MIYIILENGYPSFNHKGYTSEEECKLEVDRLNQLVRETNERNRMITEDPNYVRSRGDAFRYMEDKRIFSYKSLFNG